MVIGSANGFGEIIKLILYISLMHMYVLINLYRTRRKGVRCKKHQIS